MTALNRRQISTLTREQFVILISFTSPRFQYMQKMLPLSPTVPYSFFFFFLFNCGFYSLMLAHYMAVSLYTHNAFITASLYSHQSVPPIYVPGIASTTNPVCPEKRWE